MSPSRMRMQLINLLGKWRPDRRDLHRDESDEVKWCHINPSGKVDTMNTVQSHFPLVIPSFVLLSKVHRAVYLRFIFPLTLSPCLFFTAPRLFCCVCLDISRHVSPSHPSNVSFPLDHFAVLTFGLAVGCWWR